MPGGPKWCELFLILYRTVFSTEFKENTTDAVTVCHFRIITIEQIIPNAVTVAKHLVVPTFDYRCRHSYVYNMCHFTTLDYFISLM